MIITGFCEKPKKQQVYDKKTFLIAFEIHQWCIEKPHFLALEVVKYLNVFNLSTPRRGGNTSKSEAQDYCSPNASICV